MICMLISPGWSMMRKSLRRGDLELVYSLFKIVLSFHSLSITCLTSTIAFVRNTVHCYQ